jgi:pimeloyl-ACP methyl ester carboxylesterase
MGPPTVQFAQAGNVDIGYQVVGDGPVDLVWLTGFRSNMEVMWEEPAWAALFRRLAEFSRLVLFDRRGCGVSDRGGTTVTPTLEERMEDVAAVLDEVGSERAALFGFSEGGTVAALFAATYPERTSHVVLYGTVARIIRDSEHPWGWFSEEEFAAFIDRVSRGWGLRSAAPAAVELWAPSLAGDERFADWFAKFARQSLSRRDVVPFLRSIAAYDLVDVFPAVRVPALVLHRTDDALIPVSHARWIAQQIPEARLVELPGVDHLPFAGDAEGVAAEIEAFLVGPGASEPRGRRLLTVVATDIADATSIMTRLGDRAWRELLAAHDRELDEHLARFGGRRVTHLSEGCLAVFDGPARAIRCAVGIVDAAARLGLGVRAGLHCGECETVEDDVRGIAVHIGVRIAELATPGEVLASGTVRDLVAGSGIRFGPGRDVELQGLPGRRTVLPVLAGGASPEDIRRLAIEQANVLRRDGEYWTVAYEGTVATLRDSKGLRDLARLLAAPGRELHVLDLATERAAEGEAMSRRAAADAGLHLDSGAAEPVIDEAARTAYQQRMADIEQELDDAQTRRDADAAARARVEREALVEQLTAAYGLGGRPRRTPDHVERARKTVSRRIRTALRRIDGVHPALGRHLHASLRTGVYCSYQPERDLHWTITTS